MNSYRLRKLTHLQQKIHPRSIQFKQSKKTKLPSKYALVSICNNKFVIGLETMLFSFLKHNEWFE